MAVAALTAATAAALSNILSSITDKINRGEPVTPEDIADAGKGQECHAGTSPPSGPPPNFDPGGPPQDPRLKWGFILAQIARVLAKYFGVRP